MSNRDTPHESSGHTESLIIRVQTGWLVRESSEGVRAPPVVAGAPCPAPRAASGRWGLPRLARMSCSARGSGCGRHGRTRASATVMGRVVRSLESASASVASVSSASGALAACTGTVCGRPLCVTVLSLGETAICADGARLHGRASSLSARVGSADHATIGTSRQASTANADPHARSWAARWLRSLPQPCIARCSILAEPCCPSDHHKVTDCLSDFRSL